MAIDQFKDLPTAALFQFVPPPSDGVHLATMRSNETFQKLSPRKYANAYGSEYTIGTVKAKVALVRLPNYFIGSLSTGTVNIEDVFEKVSDLLPSTLVMLFRKAWAAAVRNAWEDSDRKLDMATIGWYDFSTEAQEELTSIFYEDIYDYLNEIAPEGSYFGGHPGDPADVGFWEEYTNEIGETAEDVLPAKCPTHDKVISMHDRKCPDCGWCPDEEDK